jgi:uncharacterized OB-fold protein
VCAVKAADWTAGVEAILYQRCGRCGSVWYIRRGFCPRCGNASPETHRSSGRGRVHAVTVVSRAPTAALRRHAPYTLLLVDVAEGFRMMAHGDAGIAIGDEVVAQFRGFGGSLVPHFVRALATAPDQHKGREA